MYNERVCCVVSATLRLQGHQDPQGDPGLPHPGRRHHERGRVGGQEHLRALLQRRALHPLAQVGRLRVPGQQGRARHQQLPVLHHPPEGQVARRQTRRLRKGHRGHGQLIDFTQTLID